MADGDGRGRVRRVVVAGGGTAGWIAAAALVRHLGPLIDVTLVESDEIGTIGVGESTVPTLRTFHDLLGIDQRRFMAATQATFKLGIEFGNWGRDGDRYLHPFGFLGRPVSWMADFHHFWLHARARGFGGELGEYGAEWMAARAGRVSAEATPALSYAFHLDAGRYARFLRALAEPAGVRRVEGRIREVALHPESGDIAALTLHSGERIAGDLFVDCTGFRALLHGEALGVPFEDWGRWIATDSAVAVQTMAAGDVTPYTASIAHRAGWRWRIPLQHRQGNGVVFASDAMSADEAAALLLREATGEPLGEPRLIRFRTGMRAQGWARNCVALGLAGGFIEPLESTSIHLIQAAVTRLIQDFPFNGCHERLRAHYNAKSRLEYENIRDFIILHYHATERDDSAFWRRCRAMDVPDTLKERMALWAGDARAFQLPHELFRVDSWATVLLGQRRAPAGHHRLAEMMPADQLRAELARMREQVAERTARLPSHAEYLRRYCPAEPA